MMLVGPSMTWLLVRTPPEAPMTIPVPAAAPLASVVLMSTIAGSTFEATPETSRPVVVPLPAPEEESDETGAANAGAASTHEPAGMAATAGPGRRRLREACGRVAP